MSGNNALGLAKATKNDEFYTRYHDIEAEMNACFEFDRDVFRDKVVLCPCDDPEWSNFTKYFAANFERFGLRKLISTSYAQGNGNRFITSLEKESPLYDVSKHDTHGKMFVLFRDKNGSGSIDTDDIEFYGYLDGDGDFRSSEVTALRDEADLVITNPPFSLFHEFISWVFEADKQFAIVGNMNALKYKEVFPRLVEGKIWLGTTSPKEFIVPSVSDDRSNFIVKDGEPTIAKFGNVCWYTNIDHGRRHSPLLLDTMAHNLKFNKKLRSKLSGKYKADSYPMLANYDALEVPFVECIPSDYKGIMAVPISFLGKHDPNQFDLLGMSGMREWAESECAFFSPPSSEVEKVCKERSRTWRVQKAYVNDESGLPLIPVYDRLFIRHKKGESAR